MEPLAKDDARHPAKLLIKTLEHRRPLSGTEKSALRDLSWHFEAFAPEQELIAYGSSPRRSCLLLEGVVARCIHSRDGQRQMTSLHIPGDFVDLHALLLLAMDHSVVSISDTIVAYVDHRDLTRLMSEHPTLGRSMMSLVAIDAAIQRNWTFNMGSRDAIARLAHFICEMYVRMSVVGVVDGDRLPLAITQKILSDVVGLSTVHTNRVVRELRESNVLSFKSGRVTILDREALMALADFDPLYLNLTEKDHIDWM